jgi:release factor glutamine methyltransferase
LQAEADAKVWTIGALVKWATEDFRSRGIESPRLDAELIVGHALGITRMQILMDGARPLDDAELAKLRALVKRRRNHEPIAYLRGEREFYGLSFRVDKRVLVPRPETELLVDVALARTSHLSLSMRALDLCTGSGCVAIVMARKRPTSKVTAVDVSDDALAVARDNAARLSAYNVAFAQGDLFGGVAEGVRFDVITANPPYIPAGEIPGLMPDVRDFEPKLALDGGADGLDLARRVAAGAPRWLAPGGTVLVESGERQAPVLADVFAAAGLTPRVHESEDLGATVVTATAHARRRMPVRPAECA